MSSSIFIVPIVLVAAYFVYRHIKKETAGGGSGTCCDCPSRGKCGSSNSHEHIQQIE